MDIKIGKRKNSKAAFVWFANMSNIALVCVRPDQAIIK